MTNELKKKKLSQFIMAVTGGALLAGSSVVLAHGNHEHGRKYGHEEAHKHYKHDWQSYTLQGSCAFLPAARATEFHGNPMTSELNLGMAGNQWVVFDNAMREFNRFLGNDSTLPMHKENGDWTLADLDNDSNRYFIELIPPGQIRKQIKSGCMLLGNDEDRNFLPGNFQVDFDVFASTNYNLMQDLANNGFIDEAVPYIANRLDLMVHVGNPKGIGTTDYPEITDTDFEKQFDIVMDLLSGDVVASNLDHINEGIHNAANGYMKKVDAYINGHAEASTPVQMNYHFGDNSHSGMKTMTAAEWLEAALQAVATPHPSSPSAKRLPGSGDPLSGDAGENHTSHNMVDNGCGTADDLVFCEFATLNKFNTHESRVHHVETPNGLVGEDGYEPVDVGFVWITEVAYQLNNGNLEIQGMVGNQDISDLGIPNTAGVNADKVYSLAHLATSENEDKGRAFINFLRSTEGQAVYTNGGFTGLTPTQMDGGKCYSKPVDGVSVATDRTGPGSCDDWLRNDSF
jgi:ABC-type molybdate transport system substrate-binding protein